MCPKSRNRWLEGYYASVDELNFHMRYAKFSAPLQRRLRRHLRRSFDLVRLRESRDLALSRLSPGLQGQIALAGAEHTWIRSVGSLPRAYLRMVGNGRGLAYKLFRDPTPPVHTPMLW